MSTASRRALLVTVSSALGLILAVFLWRNRPSERSVVLVDTREDVQGILARRAAEREKVGGDAPEFAASIDTPLLREPLSEKTARSMFISLRGGGNQVIYDPQAYYWEAPNIDRLKRFADHPLGSWHVRTNDLGFREADDVATRAPDLRVLITGDSHTAGVVPLEEMFGNVAEEQLARLAPTATVEILNGGKGGYSFYNYLGMLEKCLELDPDVFVLAAFGGNDFGGTVGTYRYFNRLRSPEPSRWMPEAKWVALRKRHTSLVSQDLNQIVAFASRPEDLQLAEVAVCQILTAIRDLCAAEGIRFLYVYIPPCTDVQPQLVQAGLDDVVQGLELTPDDLRATDRLADRILGFLKAKGVETIDMRPDFRASSAPCYWLSDLHINTEGHRLTAQRLVAVLKQALVD